MANDPTTDIGFAMCLLGLITIILSGILLQKYHVNNEHFNKIITIGSTITTIGGLIILARIA